MMKKVLIVLGLSLILLASCQSTDSSQNVSVSVSGSSTVSIRPDMATFTVSVEKRGESTVEAHSLCSEAMEEVYAILEDGFGLEEGDIVTNSISFSPEYRYEEGQQILVGQRAYQSISVTVRNLDSLAPIIDALSKVNGISLSSITLDAENKDEAAEEARKLAVLDALKRAEDYASALGMKVSGPLSVSEGNTSYAGLRLQANTLMAASSADSASRYEAGDPSVSASVSASFALSL